MKIKIEFFAIYEELLGKKDMVLVVPEGTTVKDVFLQITSEIKDRESLLASTAFALNANYTDPQTKLSDGDVLVLIPPVSGG